MKTATRESWQNLPFPSQPLVLHIDYSLNESEMEKVYLGFIPREMEDKWFIFFENDVLYFHRSWTGRCMFVAHIAKLDTNTYVITKLLADPEQYKDSDNDSIIEIFKRVIKNSLINNRYSSLTDK